jgi:hypothetical protein
MGDTVRECLFLILFKALIWLTLMVQLEVAWGVATFFTSTVKSYKSLYALRFLVGLFE